MQLLIFTGGLELEVERLSFQLAVERFIKYILS